VEKLQHNKPTTRVPIGKLAIYRKEKCNLVTDLKICTWFYLCAIRQ